MKFFWKNTLIFWNPSRTSTRVSSMKSTRCSMIGLYPMSSDQWEGWIPINGRVESDQWKVGILTNEKGVFRVSTNEKGGFGPMKKGDSDFGPIKRVVSDQILHFIDCSTVFVNRPFVPRHLLWMHPHTNLLSRSNRSSGVWKVICGSGQLGYCYSCVRVYPSEYISCVSKTLGFDTHEKLVLTFLDEN